MQHVAHRRSDPNCCNKCFAPLPPDGICRQPHATTSLPPMVEQGAVTLETQSGMIGRSHIGNLARSA